MAPGDITALFPGGITALWKFHAYDGKVRIFEMKNVVAMANGKGWWMYYTAATTGPRQSLYPEGIEFMDRKIQREGPNIGQSIIVSTRALAVKAARIYIDREVAAAEYSLANAQALATALTDGEGS